MSEENNLVVEKMLMDIQEILDKKIRGLPPGVHSDGLRAVKLHIDAAVRHYLRGQAEPDQTLFTDVIFRCNQAFEGSIKEAYRVIAGKDPSKVEPYKIEKFLAGNNILREKVFNQFTRYRQEWRNPATHDYTLDFDEGEALVAISSVTVFAIVLADQIDSKIAFDEAASKASAPLVRASEEDESLLDIVSKLVLNFANAYSPVDGLEYSRRNEYNRLEGALAGFLSAELIKNSDFRVIQEARIGEFRADILVERGGEKVGVEVLIRADQGSLNYLRSYENRAIMKAALYVNPKDFVGSVILIFSNDGSDFEVKSVDNGLSNLVRIVSRKPLHQASID